MQPNKINVTEIELVEFEETILFACVKQSSDRLEYLKPVFDSKDEILIPELYFEKDE